MRFAPQPRGAGYAFVDEIVGGSIPRQYIPAVDRGIQEAAVRGIIAGYPLVDFRSRSTTARIHTVDSNEMSFKMAGIQAFKAVAAKCKPVLLEPLDELEIITPDDYMGDVLGDLSSRRGHILGTEPGDRRDADSRHRAAGRAARLCELDPIDDAGSGVLSPALQGI